MAGDSNPTTNYKQSDEENLNIFAYMFAGLAMMLNIRLSYSAAPYALLRFKLPENLFSVFVRTTSSALELWCLPSMLLGNIMEQVYNHTQDTATGIHATNLKNFDVKTKAQTLNSTAGTQSTGELANTNLTDLQQNNQPQSGLTEKAGELKDKAEQLHTAANGIATEAAKPGNPLHPLSGQATALKNAAGTTGGTSDLYKAADTLATKAQQPSEAATGEATNVIEAFDKVEKNYDALMKLAGDNGLTNHPEVIEVLKKFHTLKTTYYQMLIIFRIQQKANAFHSAATQLQAEAKGAGPANPQLQKLHTAASGEMTTLESTAESLKNEAAHLGGACDSLIVTKYLAVAAAYKALSTKPEFTAALEAKPEVSEVKNVKETFGPLQKSIVNVLRLRVHELATLANTLNEKAKLVTQPPELTGPATQLASAASKSNTGLKQKAHDLIQAINSGAGEETKASDVITQFEDVKKRYEALAKKKEYSEKLAAALAKKGTGLDPEEQKVKDVYDAYNDLKKVYDSILNFTKLAKIVQELDTAAGKLPSNPENVITNFNAVVTVYNQLDSETKSTVQSEFDNLQTEYSNAIYFYKKCIITIPSMFTNWLNFLTFVILFIVYISGGDQGSVTGYYWVMAISGFVFGINMVLVYAVDYRYLPYYIAGENSFPIVTSAILYFATSIFGNRRKYNSDYLVVLIDISISIFIALVASVLWTVAFHKYRAPKASPDTPNVAVISPVLLVIVGMGLVYSIYPGIAPGMIVPFYLIDKIEMVLLILTTFPPLIFAFTTKYAPSWSPKTEFLLHSYLFKFGGWKQYDAPKDHGSGLFVKGDPVYGWIWHFFDILAPLQIVLAVIFIYSIHYKDSSISRSIVNQPKMSTFLTIIFYMCHEIMLATGFPGLVCNGGVTHVLLPTQWVGALLMVLLAFYSIGYITEYKRHDPSQWPTEGMTKWNAMCYWLKMASKITNKNFKQLFTTDLRRDLLLFIIYKVI